MEELNLKSCAYIGDAVWELFVREHTVNLTKNAKELHKLTTDRVKAVFQAELLEKIEDLLSEEELELMRRGRNLSIPRKIIRTIQGRPTDLSSKAITQRFYQETADINEALIVEFYSRV